MLEQVPQSRQDSNFWSATFFTNVLRRQFTGIRIVFRTDSDSLSQTETLTGRSIALCKSNPQEGELSKLEIAHGEPSFMIEKVPPLLTQLF